ncbi:uracil-DNA glycosylase family protein [Sphingobium cloacae]|uniref:Uracil-DNA glycosylase n=1 Tax=Sphingobium cloacae TaxID=120107 RepID=A0A1E1F0L1_9SPHN|nr:uracil-DNA glycosylase family protein [Sphingobium cloacae]BAV63992.1 uracil-DNA glycosylase [Sphingobium cloacae]
MRGALQIDWTAAADAYLAWWAQAGADGAVSERPVNWLRPVPAPGAKPAAAIPAPAMPSTLAAFHDWLAGDATQPERRWPASPILPAGPQAAPVMIVTDMPDPADVSANGLFADRTGALLDAMLRAIGMSRADVYIASLFTARPPGGMVEASDIDFAARRMRAHVALAAPRRLLLLGDRTSRALLPPGASEEADGLRFFNHDGGTLPVIATFHPRLLLTQPAAKAECWRVLQSLIEESRS